MIGAKMIGARARADVLSGLGIPRSSSNPRIWLIKLESGSRSRSQSRFAFWASDRHYGNYGDSVSVVKYATNTSVASTSNPCSIPFDRGLQVWPLDGFPQEVSSDHNLLEFFQTSVRDRSQ